MRYRLTCLTPTLIGDGQKLSPIDYMVWKDQVNVLDQRRIFRLLAKGPRLDGYLAQLKKADKLDFASWGGFAQNFADRRIAFEHASAAAHWERAKGDSLHIPVFAAGPGGPYVPGSAIKGALRTGMLFARWKDGFPEHLVRAQGERFGKRMGEAAEEQALGSPGASLMRAVIVGDSRPVPASSLKIFLLRVSTLQPRGPGRFELGWKQAPRGAVDGRRPEEATPLFAEMAVPGTVFEGEWRERSFLNRPEMLDSLHWSEPVDYRRLFAAANEYAAGLLRIQKQYAGWAGLSALHQNLTQIEARLPSPDSRACLLAIGWGSGLLAKAGWLDTDSETFRGLLAQAPLYSRALKSGLPFPKTRRIVFLANQPAALPGWGLLELI